MDSIPAVTASSEEHIASQKLSARHQDAFPLSPTRQEGVMLHMLCRLKKKKILHFWEFHRTLDRVGQIKATRMKELKFLIILCLSHFLLLRQSVKWVQTRHSTWAQVQPEKIWVVNPWFNECWVRSQGSSWLATVSVAVIFSKTQRQSPGFKRTE